MFIQREFMPRGGNMIQYTCENSQRSGGKMRVLVIILLPPGGNVYKVGWDNSLNYTILGMLSSVNQNDIEDIKD